MIFVHDDWRLSLTEDSASSSPSAQAFLPAYAEEHVSNPQGTGEPQFSSRQTLGPGFIGLKCEPQPRHKPLIQGFERPSLVNIGIIAVLCLVTYPTFHLLTLVGRDKPLFTVRLIVAAWCAVVGTVVGSTLLKIIAQHLDAAIWATVIHKGMKVRDLDQYTRKPESFLAFGFAILLSRLKNNETARSLRGSHDRPWSLYIGFVLFASVTVALLPFIFGRIMIIETFNRSQSRSYREVLIAGDLSPDDVARATQQLGAFQSFAQTWTLLPYGRTPPDTVEFVYDNDTVYFPQPSSFQLTPGGSGSGTFNANHTALISTKVNPSNQTASNWNSPQDINSEVLRYSQWGIRIHCQKLPHPTINLIPLSNQNFTYALLPQDFLGGLFASYNTTLPVSLMKPDFGLLDAKDTIPATIDRSKISYLIKWYDNGVGHSFHTRTILDTGFSGWTTVETVLIRLNDSFTPSGRFPVYSNVSIPDARGVKTKVGYDAAVCVEKYDPWIIEAYNSSTGAPVILRIVGTSDPDASKPSGNIQGIPLGRTRFLNSTGKNPAFFVAHDNSINQMVKDNGRDYPYVPSPIGVSFTDGAGPEGYTELSSDRLAVIRARVDAANVLPFLVGTGPVVAQSYPDDTIAYVTYARWQLVCVPLFVLFLGVAGELFVPTLPMNLPRRGFGVYSWMALIQSQELRLEATHDLDKLLTLEELEKRLSDKELKFVV